MPDSLKILPSDSKVEQLDSAVSTHEGMTQNNVSTVVGLLQTRKRQLWDHSGPPVSGGELGSMLKASVTSQSAEQGHSRADEWAVKTICFRSVSSPPLRLLFPSPPPGPPLLGVTT